MSKKYYHLIAAALFCLFFGGLAVLGLLTPDRDFSPEENRSLQQRPRLAAAAVLDGSFMTKAESYAADQIPLRDGWVHLKARCERLMGKKENNDVFFASDGSLIKRVPEPDAALMEKGLQALNALTENAGVPVYFGLIPTAAEVQSDKLPRGADTADEAAWIERLYSSTSAIPVDMTSVLSAHKDEYIYYGTDHHWTSLGALYGGMAVREAMGLPVRPAESYEKTVMSTEFYGTAYSAASADWVQPDEMCTYVPETGVTVESFLTGEAAEGRLYVRENLEKKDKYSFFLGGNQPRCIVRSENAGGRILLIRDSYSDSMVPFLTDCFSEIHLLDLRYYRDSVQEYIRENGIDAVLVIYGFSTYISDTNQPLLAR